MSTPKLIRELRRKYPDLVVGYTGSGRHLRLRTEDGEVVAVTSATPSCPRTMQNLDATVRRWKRSKT